MLNVVSRDKQKENDEIYVQYILIFCELSLKHTYKH